jgi:hypothetical protein
MANIKVSQLPAASTPLTGTELAMVVQGGVSKKTALSTLFSSDVGNGYVYNVKSYGAKGDGTTDDTAAIQAALQAAYNQSVAQAAPIYWRTNTVNVYFPRGKYRIATPNALFAGLTLGSFRLVGDGKWGITQLIYDVPSATSGQYMIYNNDIFGFTSFENMAIVCNSTANNQQFMYYYSAVVNAQNFTFKDVYFVNFGMLFDVQGTTNASENTFINCSIRSNRANSNDTMFKMSNPQSVNWRFFGCDAEGFSGALFELYKGTQIFWYQGSILPGHVSGRIIRVPSGADYTTFGTGNAPNVTFYGVRYEMGYGALQIEKINSACETNFVYDSCGMGGGNIPSSTYKMFTWTGNGQLTLRNCGQLTNYLFNITGNGSLGDGLFNVYIDKCPTMPASMINGSIYVVSGASYNTGAYPVFSVSNCNHLVDGVYRPYDSQFMSEDVFGSWNNPTVVSQQKRALCFHPETNTIGFINASASVVTITIASPGVVTWNGHGLAADTPITFSTTGALPTGISAGTTYYVKSPLTNSFNVAASPGGAAINTSGTQSGTHTCTTSGGVQTYTVRTPPVRISGFELFPVVNGTLTGTNLSVTITIKNAAGTTLGTFTGYNPASSTTKQTVDVNYFVNALSSDYLQIVVTYFGSGEGTRLKGNLYVTY